MIGTLEDFKAWAAAHDWPVDEETDPDLTEALETASGVVATRCHRQLEPDEDDVETVVRGTGSKYLVIPQSVSVTSLDDENGVEVAQADYLTYPQNEQPITLLERVEGYWPVAWFTVTHKRGYKDPLPSEVIRSAFVLAAEDLWGGIPEGIKQVSIQGISVTVGAGGAEQVDALLANHVRGF